MFDSDDRIDRLRRKIARIEGQRPIRRPVGGLVHHDEIDHALNHVARGHVHEIFAAERDDAGGAAGFAAMLGCNLGGTVMWLRAASVEGELHAPGLREIGLDPALVILGVLPDASAVLRAGLDTVRCPGIGVAILELWGSQPRLDLTASRRLAVAAEASGVAVLVLRIAAAPSPSAAHTRWAVRSAPSLPLDAGGPGHPALEVELLRQRGGPEGGRWLLEWDRDRRVFKDRDAGRQALSGTVVPFSAGGSAGAGIPASGNG